MKFLSAVSALLARYTSAFVIATAVFAYFLPDAFSWVRGNVQTAILGFIMLTMGMTLSVKDFKVVAERPFDICAAAAAQYTIMPLLAFGIARLLGLSDALTAGLLLIGCCPGGVSSNIMSFIGRGDVAFSVGTTSVSTILAPVLTPFLCLHLAGRAIEVDAMGMFVSILLSVVGPVALGFLANLACGRTRGYKALVPLMPGLSVIGLACIVGGVTSAHGGKFANSAAIMFVAIFLHNTAGYALGYLAGWIARMSVPKCRTMSLEVGMQNAGLATVLAGKHFPMYPDAAIASAVACVYHSISGAVLAGVFRWWDDRRTAKTRQ